MKLNATDDKKKNYFVDQGKSSNPEPAELVSLSEPKRASLRERPFKVSELKVSLDGNEDVSPEDEPEEEDPESEDSSAVNCPNPDLSR
uniref:Uncharacterized protein n=1 Tax=Tetranychus urticae TaxID=32264 RepID=T1JPQ7_TETUR